MENTKTVNTESFSSYLLNEVVANKGYIEAVNDLAGILIEDIIKLSKVMEDNNTELSDKELKFLKDRKQSLLIDLIMNDMDELEESIYFAGWALNE